MEIFKNMKKVKTLLAIVAIGCALNMATAVEIPGEYLDGDFFVGTQAYTFKNFTFFEAIEMNAAAGGKVIELSPVQDISKDINQKVDMNMSEENMDKIKEKLAQYGMKAVNFGVVSARDEAGYRKIFEFCKKMDIPTFSCEPPKDHLPILDKLVKEYDINVAIHNHRQEIDNPGYWVWDPVQVYNAIKDLDHRIGSGADTGHWMRSGLDPVYCLKILEGRILSLHLKDLSSFDEDAHDVPYGTGVGNINEMLTELKRQGFKGNIAVEYEYNWDNSLPEVSQCIGFVRGFGAAQK